ncbi:hypothetical protein P3G55_14610 [Leptospira sp. 96542]|nr:hypothetical protein [Leptospira sp. 96542]
MLKRQFVFLFIISSGLFANPALDRPAEVILGETRLSRIPQVILSLEERAKLSADSNQFLAAREDLKKAIQLKQAIGMKDSEGNAKLLVNISKLESKLGNQCEAAQLSKLAKKIYIRLGLITGAVSLEQNETPKPREYCTEVSWIKE